MICEVLRVLAISYLISFANSALALEWSCVEEYESSNFNKLCTTSKDNSEFAIEIKLSDNKPKYLNVKCESQQLINFSDFDMLVGLYLHLGHNATLTDLKSVEIESCTLSDSLCKFIGSFSSDRVESSGFRQSNNTQGKCIMDQVVNIKDVTFYKTKLVKVRVDLFEGLINLENLDLMKNNIQELPPGIFKSITKLEFLDLGSNDINNLDAFIFTNLPELKTLHLWGNPIKTLPQGLFSGIKNLQTLDIHSCGLKSLNANLLTDLARLQYISLIKNNFSSLPEGLFKDTPLLQNFMLYDNNQPLQLPSGLLSNLTSLRSVLLNGNDISVVPENLFQGSTTVLQIRLERNALTTLPVHLFSDTTALQSLDLSSNQLTSLPGGIFFSLTKLKKLDLSENRLISIPGFMFGRLLKLEELYLENNSLNLIHSEAFPSESCRIKKINLSHNQLTFSDKAIHAMFESISPLQNCRSLETIILKNNSIAEIFQDWRLFGELSYLDLSDNSIQSLKNEDIEFLSDKISLKLVNNNITHIDMDLVSFQPLGSSEKKLIVFLEGNPIRCDCSMYSFLRYIENPNSLNLETDAMTCASPKELSGLSLGDLKSEYITCNVTVDCPEQCTCQWRPYDDALIVNCTGLGLTQAPRHLPWKDGWKYTEVHLERNLLETLPNLSYPGYDQVTKLYASHNNISRLDPHNLSPKLLVLDLTNNQLSTQNSRSAFEYILKKKWTLKNVTLNHNKWQCDCEARDLLNFLHTHVGKVDNVTCLDGRSMMPLSPEDICSTSYHLVIALSTSFAAAGILLGLLATLYYRFQMEVKVWLYSQNLCLWFVTEEELDKDKEYDAFICYSHKDGDFVENYLVPGLEAGPYLFKLCLHVRDWVPGEWITTQIMRSVKTSRRTVIVLSHNFLESVWGLVEFRAAHKQTMSDGRARVIILLYGDLGSLGTLDPELQGYLSMNTYITWDDPWFWKKMHYALPHPMHIAQVNKLKRLKNSLSSKTLETDLQNENSAINLKVSTYTPTNVDPNYNVNGYVGLHSSSPKIKTVVEEEKEQCLS